jgi:hypothetical protein
MLIIVEKWVLSCDHQSGLIFLPVLELLNSWCNKYPRLSFKKLRNCPTLLGAQVLMGIRELEALLRYYSDRFEPTELVEHLDIDIEDLLGCLEDWIKYKMNMENAFQEDLEHITTYGEED